MGRSIVKTFRLKIGRDNDIISKINDASDLSVSDIVRDALRYYYCSVNHNVPVSFENVRHDNIDKMKKEFNNIELEKVEKNEFELETDLDNLLSNF